MREMKDSCVKWIGLIPSTWDVIPLFSSFYEGKNKNILGNENNLLSLSYGKIVRKNINSNEGLLPGNYYGYNIVEKGDIIIRPTDLQNDKRSLRTGLVNEKGIITSAYIDLKPYRNINTSYYHYLLHSYDLSKVFYNMGNGVRQGINYSVFSKLPVLLPPIDEQIRIVHYLDLKCAQIDSTINKQKETIEKLKEYKVSIITEAVTKGIKPHSQMKNSGYYWMPYVPVDWEESTVLKCIRFEGGSQPSMQFFIDHPKDGYIRLIQNRDYKTDEYATYVPQHMVNKFCDENDIMVGRYGPPVFVLHRGLKGAYNVAIMKAIPVTLEKEFVWYYLQNKSLLSYIESFSARTAGQSGVNPNILKKYPLFVPPIKEQDEIIDFLNRVTHEIDVQIEKRQSLIDLYSSLKEALIYEVVTGKTEV